MADSLDREHTIKEKAIRELEQIDTALQTISLRMGELKKDIG
jgi:hypothetical protein